MRDKDKSKYSFLKIIIWPFKSYLRIIGVVIFIGFYQYQTIQVDILAREIRSMELKRNQLSSKNAALKVDIDQLTHINRIVKLAGERYGLVAPGQKMEKLVIQSFSPEKKNYLEEQNKNLKLAGVH